MPGWIYALNTPSHRWLKIGKTTRLPADRAREIYDTGSPFPYSVVHAEHVEDPHAAEMALHEKLSAYRVNKDREFFDVPIHLAIQIMREIAEVFKKIEISTHLYSFTGHRIIVEPRFGWGYFTFIDHIIGIRQMDERALALEYPDFSISFTHLFSADARSQVARDASNDVREDQKRRRVPLEYARDIWNEYEDGWDQVTIRYDAFHTENITAAAKELQRVLYMTGDKYVYLKGKKYGLLPRDLNLLKDRMKNIESNRAEELERSDMRLSYKIAHDIWKINSICQICNQKIKYVGDAELDHSAFSGFDAGFLRNPGLVHRTCYPKLDACGNLFP